MAEKKLSFAIFGNASKAFDSLQITEILDYLREHEADVYIEQNFYNSLQKELKKSISIAGVFEGVNFDVDYVISLGGDGTFLKAASKGWSQANTYHWREYGTVRFPRKCCPRRN